jgi:hypothetical protein
MISEAQKKAQKKWAHESFLRLKADPVKYRAFLDKKSEIKRKAREAGTYREKPRLKLPQTLSNSVKLAPIAGTTVLPPVGFEYPMFLKVAA